MSYEPTTNGNQNCVHACVTSGWINGEWTYFRWFRPASFSGGVQHLIQVGSAGTTAIRITRQSATVIRAELIGSPSNLTLNSPAITMADDEWGLLMFTFDPSTGAATLTVQTESGAKVTTSGAVSGLTLPNATQIFSPLKLSFTPFDGKVKEAFRAGVVGQGTFDLLWSRKHPEDLLAGDLDGEIFGDMPAPTSSGATTPLLWSFGMQCCSAPQTDGTTTPTQAMPGDTITANNCVVYNRSAAGSPVSFTVARAVTVTDVKYSDDPYDNGFFTPRVPAILSGAQSVANVSPRMRALARAETPDALVRVIVSGNSRAVRTTTGAGSLSDALYYALSNVRTAFISGVSLVPGDLSGSPRFALPHGQAQSGGRNADGTNYSRIGTHGIAAAPGPGRVRVLDDAGDSQDFVVAERSGSLFTAAGAAKVRAVMLRYPGSGAATVTPITASTGGGARSDGTPEEVALDNQAGAAATVVSATSTGVVVSGDVTDRATPGAVVAVLTGTGSGINQVVSSEFAGGNTTITLRHTWDETPEAADTVGFGPHEYARVDVAHAGGAGTYRGVKVAHSSTTSGLPVLAVGFGAWAVDGSGDPIPGFAVGGFGCGGEGHAEQLDKSFDGALGKLFEAFEAHLHVPFPAYQESDSGDFGPFVEACADNSPDLETAPAGDIRHFTINTIETAAMFLDLHGGMRQYAIDHFLAFATALERPDVGHGAAFLMRGWGGDVAHPNAYGNEAIWTALLSMFADAALPTADSPRSRTRGRSAWTNGVLA